MTSAGEIPNYGALAGIRVLDASQMLAGPICAMRLGDLGADVIKIEPPGRGEWTRNRTLRNVTVEGTSPSLLALNRNKRSVTINLKSDEGIKAFDALVETADVLIQNYRVGTAERIGIGYERLRKINPRLIYCSISGYGEVGPYASRPGQDLVIQGYSGSLWAVGRESDPPIPNALWSADVMSGYQAAIGILSAVIARQHTDEGQRVDVSMLATVMDCEIQELTTHLNSGLLPTRTAEPSAHGWIGAPYGIYATADGFLALAYMPIEGLAEISDCPELAKFGDISDGFEHRDEIVRLVADKLKKRPTAEWLEEMFARGYMAGPVYNYAELANDPHVRETGMIVEIENPTGGTYLMPDIPLKMSGTPPSIRRRPPGLGEHTDEVLGEIPEFDDSRLAELHASGAI
jgi:crotonobetainyl-CoA:carnitine CoA-transferase CaiB-like acyl-CoA transferase